MMTWYINSLDNSVIFTDNISLSFDFDPIQGPEVDYLTFYNHLKPSVTFQMKKNNAEHKILIWFDNFIDETFQTFK